MYSFTMCVYADGPNSEALLIYFKINSYYYKDVSIFKILDSVAIGIGQIVIIWRNVQG
jgi:hypothetical protein